ncbi:uncharacterized protein LOC122366907 [Amphibalanus amphitrite]|nr:uncharacterized protein LOC122366907 [Amphibalanus amphitrite]
MPGLEGQAGSALVSVPVPPPTEQQRQQQQQRPGPAAGPDDTGAERRQRTGETSPKKVYLSPGAAAGQRRAVPLRLVRLEPPLPSQETGRRPEVRVRSAEHHLSGIKETDRASRHPRRRQQRTKKTRKVSKWEQSAEETTRPAARVPCFPPCPELQLEPDDRQLQLRKLERQRRLWLLQRQSDTIFLSNWREKARKMQKELFFRTVKYASDGLRCGPLVTPYDSPGRPLSADPLVAHCPPEPGQPTQPDAPMNVKRSWAERVRDGDQLQRDVSAVVRRIQSGQLRPASSPRGQLRESSRRLLELESLLKSLEQFRLRHPLPR